MAPPLQEFSRQDLLQSSNIDELKQGIDWATQEKRNFFKHKLQTRLIGLYVEKEQYKDALELITQVLKELKKLDDKLILTEVHLYESQVHYALLAFHRAKAALTSARTAANSIFCPPLLQAELDMQSGILHAEDKDFKTAYSYFYEALEGFSAHDSPEATRALKFMILVKVMSGASDQVPSIMASKVAQKHIGPATDAMLAVVKAQNSRSMSEFEQALKTYKSQLSDDPIIKSHLAELYDTMLEQNIIRIIEPYSRIELQHIANKVQQPLREVQAKLSQMILDKVISAVLDQGAGCLIIYEPLEGQENFNSALETIEHLSTVVAELQDQALRLQVA